MVVVPPRIVPFSFEEPIFAGQAAQVTCLVSEGDLPLNISWSFSAAGPQTSGRRSLDELGVFTNPTRKRASTLVIEATGIEHRGNFTCSAVSVSSAAMTTYTAELNIHGKNHVKLSVCTRGRENSILLSSSISVLYALRCKSVERMVIYIHSYKYTLL